MFRSRLNIGLSALLSALSCVWVCGLSNAQEVKIRRIVELGNPNRLAAVTISREAEMLSLVSKADASTQVVMTTRNVDGILPLPADGTAGLMWSLLNWPQRTNVSCFYASTKNLVPVWLDANCGYVTDMSAAMDSGETFEAIVSNGRFLLSEKWDEKERRQTYCFRSAESLAVTSEITSPVDVRISPGRVSHSMGSRNQYFLAIERVIPGSKNLLIFSSEPAEIVNREQLVDQYWTFSAGVAGDPVHLLTWNSDHKELHINTYASDGTGPPTCESRVSVVPDAWDDLQASAHYVGWYSSDKKTLAVCPLERSGSQVKVGAPITTSVPEIKGWLVSKHSPAVIYWNSDSIFVSKIADNRIEPPSSIRLADRLKIGEFKITE